MKKIWVVLTVLWLVFPNMIKALDYKEDLGISLEEKQVQNLSRSGLKIVFYVNLVNSSSEDYYLTGYSYRFLTGVKEYLRMQVPLQEGLKVQAMDNTLIALPVKITYDLLFQTVPELENSERVQCAIKGEFEFFSERRRRKVLPFAFDGEFPIFEPPDVEVEAIKINDLTIAGADFDIQVNFINKNNFELFVNKIHYSIRIGGYLIDQSRIPGDKGIKKNGERKFSLNALVNFYEVGKDIYGFFQQDSVDCRFSGEIELDTVWGTLNFPFDVKKKADIVK